MGEIKLYECLFYLGAGVPRGASATSAPGAVAAPKLGAGLEFKKKKLKIFRRPEIWLGSPCVEEKLRGQFFGALAESNEFASDEHSGLVEVAAAIWVRQLPDLRSTMILSNSGSNKSCLQYQEIVLYFDNKCNYPNI